MKKLLFLILFCPLFAAAQYYEPMRGRYVPPKKQRYNYDLNRSIATGLFAFMGGVIRDDSRRARFVKQGIFVGTAVSIGCGKKRPMKYILRDLGAGVLGVSFGYIVKNQIPDDL